ncbi:MAG: Macrolide export ATP-binding/permease protein MacB [Gemmatimonadaceae bacterium]|nr:Macrolide export ATP-binding/permease protein MacB [Gemmatimonadaceae bacterium]
MPLLEAVRLAVSQIRVQKLKSFFTLLGVSIGVMFLIAVVSIVQGMGRYMEDDLVGKIITKGTFEVRRRPNINMGDVDESVWREYATRPRVTEDDIEPVTSALAPGARWAIISSDAVTVESRYARPRKPYLNAVSEQWMGIKNLGVVEGRMISPQEYDMGSHVVIIGQDVKSHFFPGINPIGRELKIADLPYTVVGVAEKQGSAFGISMDSFLIVPYRSPAHRLVNRFKVIDAVVVQSSTEVAMRADMESVRQAMRQQRKLRPSQKDNFVLETSDSALEFWRKIQGLLVWAGIALPAIGLVVGAIVIMNIMLVAVAERTREIGVRKALGARRRDILSQFIVESIVLAIVGSILGILAGTGLAKLISAVSPLPAEVALWSVIVAVAVGAGVGVVAGVYPASRASRLDPVVALRQE